MYVLKVKAPGLMAPYNNDDCRRRGKRVWTTCRESLRSRALTGIDPATSWSQARRPTIAPSPLSVMAAISVYALSDLAVPLFSVAQMYTRLHCCSVRQINDDDDTSVVGSRVHRYRSSVCMSTVILTVIWYSITHSLFLSSLKNFLLYKSFPL